MTAVAADGAGYLVLHRATTPPPGTSTLTFTPESVRSNNATVHLGGGAFTAVAYPAGRTVHLVVDVSGYYE